MKPTSAIQTRIAILQGCIRSVADSDNPEDVRLYRQWNAELSDLRQELAYRSEYRYVLPTRLICS